MLNEKSSTATFEELVGMSPAQFRRDIRRMLARDINGYELISCLKLLIEGCIGYELFGLPDKIVCYCKGPDEDWQVAEYVEPRIVEALERMRLVEARVPRSDEESGEFRKLYVATPNAQRFLAKVPEDYKGSDQQFWTAILEDAPNRPPVVYPYIAPEEPDLEEILSSYDVIAPESGEPRITRNGLRWIPAAAFALDAYPALEGKVGPRIIRSWFDTVINPILADLKHKESLLVLRNWTWRIPPGHLESLRPVEESPWHVSTDNLEQFISFYPHVADLIQHHDVQVCELEDACRALHTSLSVSQPVKDAYAKANEDNSLTDTQGTPINRVLRGPEEQDIDLLAQYIVNTAGELPHYHVYSPVWNKYKADFLSSLEDPAARPLREATVQAGEKLLTTVSDLTALLKQIRARLSLQFDVPFVTGQSAPEE